MKYAWKAFTYNKRGELIEEKTSKDLVLPKNIPTVENDIYTKQYTYVKGRLVSEIDSEGRQKSYEYDKDNRVIKLIEKVSPTENQITVYQFALHSLKNNLSLKGENLL